MSAVAALNRTATTVDRQINRRFTHLLILAITESPNKLIDHLGQEAPF